jgi:hypothetical protein
VNAELLTGPLGLGMPQRTFAEAAQDVGTLLKSLPLCLRNDLEFALGATERARRRRLRQGRFAAAHHGVRASWPVAGY